MVPQPMLHGASGLRLWLPEAFACEMSKDVKGKGGKRFKLSGGNLHALKTGSKVTFAPKSTGKKTEQAYSIMATDGKYITLSLEDSKNIDLPGVPLH